MDLTFAAKFLGALFAIMNPFINLPLFLALTDGKSTSQQRALAAKVALYTAVMCAVVALAGNGIIAFFGVTIESFHVAGGLVLLGIAMAMLNGRPITSHERGQNEKSAEKSAGGGDANNDISFYPMTFPMVVGPGTIATLIIYSAQARNIPQYIGFAAVLTTILAALFVVLFFASAIGRLLSVRMRVVMTRLMGMILAAIAIEMVSDGAQALLPGLG